ncbi:phage holin family protein [Cecembia rubra]|uniref:Putative superfamily III holin-X n=1 Tax=Cecembia rubra TaxID=1485585 RepID=A0A2P8E097_9BACT|nr:phage holin family protein [Cecembia rubra]PSL02898.1 putative superfamily III holin-X [Cecembia rubra]
MLNISEIIQTIKQLIEVRMQLIKDEVNEKISTIMARIFLLLLMMTVSVMVLLFVSFSLAFYLSEKMYSTYKGFLYVGLLYLLIFILIYFLKDSKGILGSFQNFLKNFVFRGRNKED